MDTNEKSRHNRNDLRPDLMAPEPLYKQVKRKIIDGLTQGEWKPGEKLPSESKLATRYQVGISTVRAAIGEFVVSGVLTRKQGKGTFVSLHNEQRYNYQFFHVVADDGTKKIPSVEIVSLRKGEADDEIADLLRMPRRAGLLRVFKIRQILRIGEIPVVASDIVIPATLFKGMNEKILGVGGEALYGLYQRHFGINIIRTSAELRGTAADPWACEVFGLPKNAPLLKIRRVAFTFGDQPVEVRMSQIDTRQFHFRLDEGERA